MLKNYPLQIKIIILFIIAIFFILMLSCNLKRKKGKNIEKDIITENLKLDAPEKISAIGFNNSIIINWNKVTNAASYNIYWATNPDVNKTNGEKISGITQNTYIHQMLNNENPYYYIITAENNNNESNESIEVNATPHKDFDIILNEDFEDNSLESRISIDTLGTFKLDPQIKDIKNFGSEKAFGFGMSTNKDSPEDNVSSFKINFMEKTYISNIFFNEMELYGNLGSNGIVYIDGKAQEENFGRYPEDDNKADELYRIKDYLINKYIKEIELRVKNITNASEIYIDNLKIIGKNNYLKTNVFIKAGGYHSLALKNNNKISAWGYNKNGQLGDSTIISRPNPVNVFELSNITALDGGGSHS
ncbi:MAG: hypothetical protein HY934_10090, partial [Candidatus Firestonebacteria bacterium]|nr:hypothetical protein [Candidatus Firestonebacteria bacterium]